MIRRPPRSTRTDTLFPTRRSSDLTTWLHDSSSRALAEQPPNSIPFQATDRRQCLRSELKRPVLCSFCRSNCRRCRSSHRLDLRAARVFHLPPPPHQLPPFRSTPYHEPIYPLRFSSCQIGSEAYSTPVTKALRSEAHTNAASALLRLDRKRVV